MYASGDKKDFYSSEIYGMDRDCVQFCIMKERYTSEIKRVMFEMAQELKVRLFQFTSSFPQHAPYETDVHH